MKIRKIIAVILSAAMTFTMLSVSASAAGIFDTAKSVKSGESVSFNLSRSSKHDYKIKLSENSDLKLSFNAKADDFEIFAFNADGNIVKPSSYKFSSGKGDIDDGALECEANKALEVSKGTVTYTSLKKGTYYIRIKGSSDRDDFYGDAKATVKFTVSKAAAADTPAEKPADSTVSSDAFLLRLTIEEDDTVRLDALVNGDVKWSSSDPSVATVSSTGKVRGISVGTAVITAKCGEKAAKIQIKVVYDD